MKKLIYILAAFAFCALLTAEPALAKHAKAVPEWRHWWDLGWKLANFLILAFLIVKMAKQPLKDFVANRKALVQDQIQAMEEAKAAAQKELAETKAKTANLQAELSEYEKILEDTAERDRQRLLEEARNESELILERAQVQAELALGRARTDLAAEILDLAAELAEEKLKDVVTKEDQARFIDLFTQSVAEAETA